MSRPPGLDRRTLRPALALAMVLAVHVALVVATVQARGNIWHDEAISLLSATGHQDEWAAIEHDQAAPYGEWAQAREYRRLLEVDRPLDLQGVSRSVGDYDHHPPLFYWLLHIALLAGVPTLWAGPVLNLVAMAAVVTVIFRLVWRTTASSVLGATASAAAAWSPAVVGSTAEALPYPLLALMLVVLAALCHRIATIEQAGRPFGRAETAAGIAILVAGMLTHHQFVGFSLIGLGMAWWWGGSRRRDSAVRLAVSWAGAVGMSWLLFPYFLDHVTAVSAGAGFDSGLIAGRLSRWLNRAADVVVVRATWDDMIRLGVRAVVVVAAVAAIVRWRQGFDWMRSHRPAAAVIMTAIVVAAVPPLLYALQRTPEHAYGSRYVAFLWPLVLAGVAVSGLGLRRGVLGLIAAASLVFTLDAVAAARPVGDNSRAMLAELADADAVLVDCASRGYFPTVARHLEPETAVLLATGADLVAALQGGLDLPAGDVVLLDARCPDPGDVLGALSAAGYTAAPAGSVERFAVYRVTAPVP